MLALTPVGTPLKFTLYETHPLIKLNAALVAAAPPPLRVQPWFASDAEPYATMRSLADGQYNFLGGAGVGDDEGVGEGGETEPPHVWIELGLAFVPTARQPAQ